MTERKPSWIKRVTAGATVATAVTAADPANAQAGETSVPPDVRQMDMSGSGRRLPPENYGGSLGAIIVGASLWALRRPRRSDPGQGNDQGSSR